MNSFYDLYYHLLDSSINKTIDKELIDTKKILDFDEHHLDCLLNPDKHPTVIRLGDCSCSEEQMEECQKSCEFNADNPYVIELLNRLGYETIESLLKNDNMFIRDMFK